MDTNDTAITTALDAWTALMTSDSYSPATIRARCSVVRRCSRHGRTDPHRIAEDHVRGFLSERPRSAWTRRIYLNHLRAWSRHAQIPDPTAKIRLPKRPAFTPRPIAEQHLSELLAGADERMRAWIVLGAFTGLRASETATLSAEQLQLDGDRWQLYVTGKGGKGAIVPLAPVVTRALAPFTGGGRLWQVEPLWVSVSFARYARRHEVVSSYHQLRHRFGTQTYRTTRDLLRTQHLMRHSNPNTTMAYVALEDGFGDAVDGLPGAS